MNNIISERYLSPLQRFWRLLQPDYKEIRNVYIYAVFAGVISLSLPLGIQAIVNLIQGGRVSTAWIVLVSFVVLGVAATGLLQIFQLRITENLQQRIFTRSAFEFAYRIPRIKMEELYKHYAPELMNRFFDTVSVQKGLSKILIDFSTAAFYVVFGLILLSFYHPFFILFSVILVFLVFGIFSITAKKGLKTSLTESKHKYRVAHWLEELARTSTTFKLAGRSELPLNRADSYVMDYLEARESHFKILLRQYWLMVAFKVVVATGLLAIGGILVMEQRMNIGQFVAAEIIILSVMSSVEKLILALETIYDVLTGIEKIAQVTDLDLEQREGLILADYCNDQGLAVDLHEVYFAYPRGKDILKDLSLGIKGRERLAIAGPNGSGKSTLLHIIAGLYELKSGNIAYNGLPKGNLNLDSLREVIGDCLTHEMLFEGTVYDNIAMGRKGATFDNIRWAVRELGLEEFIDSLPKGYNTKIEPQGKTLPRSVVQKLLLARSVADKPKLLLLEDAFVRFTKAERKQVVDFLTDPENPWTLVAVSSDPYMASRSDRVIIMDDGQIVESGKMEDLDFFKDLKPESNA